ncbi:leucine-rich repeat domain-containing protein [Eggerthella sinensis]|uniref:leucine-rich repeat domain-containing protein n=1 Tax=Eggerthella sinensis TaxID=242230 RepID=UPI00266D2D33|nr:leucine-rich repeat domain-containing protein [Eggerthella sinensis]
MVEAAIAYAKVKVEGVVKTQAADFVIEAGVLKEYHGASSEVVVPSNVTIIGEGFNETPVTSVVLPDGLKKMSRAFQKCDSLKSISLPAGLNEIFASFNACDSLESISLPAGLNEISSSFFGCKSLKSITLPNKLENLKGSFGYSALEQVTIPGGIHTIGDDNYENGCFSGCDSLKEVILEEGISCIGSACFTNCSSLKEITIPSSVKKIESFAFQECKNLSTVTFLGSHTKLEMSTFCRCPALTVVNAPASVIKGIFRDYGKLEWRPFYETPWYRLQGKEECRALGICEHCGGNIKGVLVKKCSHCGRKY